MADYEQGLSGWNAILELRAHLRKSLVRRNDTCWICKECETVIVNPTTNIHGAVDEIDGAIETVTHALNCSYTKHRVEVGLEHQPTRWLYHKLRKTAILERRVREAKEHIELFMDEISALRMELEGSQR